MSSGIQNPAVPGVCPLCGHSGSLAFHLAHAPVWRCSFRTCGLEFAFPQLDETELSHCYRTLYYPDDAVNHKVMFENSSEDVLQQFFDQLNRRLGPLSSRRLLDYGCGSGRLLRIAKERGFQPTGIETDDVARRAASDNSGSTVFKNIDELQTFQPSAKFDFIILWTVIEHLRAPWVDLARLRALLSPGGWLYLSTMDIRCLRARLEGRRWENYANPTHLFYFDDVSSPPRHFAAHRLQHLVFFWTSRRTRLYVSGRSAWWQRRKS